MRLIFFVIFKLRFFNVCSCGQHHTDVLIQLLFELKVISLCSIHYGWIKVGHMSEMNDVEYCKWESDIRTLNTCMKLVLLFTDLIDDTTSRIFTSRLGQVQIPFYFLIQKHLVLLLFNVQLLIIQKKNKLYYKIKNTSIGHFLYY